MSIPPGPPPAPLPNGNPYDFILNSGNQKKGYSPGNSSSMTQRLIIVAAGAVILILVLIIAFSLIFKGNGGNTTQLTDLAEQQNEIARVADIGVQKATSDTTKGYAHTVKISMISNQQQTLALLSKNHHKVSNKQLALKTNTNTDQTLAAAAANNSFDATFTQLIKDELNSYRTSLQKAYKSTANTNEKQLLLTSFNGVNILIGDKQSS